jgi:hypothetical protein
MASYLTIQTLKDDGGSAIIKVTERFDSANNRFFPVVSPQLLRFANTSQNCGVSITKVEYSTGFSTGCLKLYWDSSLNPTDVVCIGKTQSGTLNGYMVNTTDGTMQGNLNLQVYNTGSNDCYTLIIHVNKEFGYANAYIEYNAADYRP